VPRRRLHKAADGDRETDRLALRMRSPQAFAIAGNFDLIKQLAAI
jgi:hypothetical protein